MKKVIAACIDQVLQFDSEQEVEKFLDHLKSRKQMHTVVWKNKIKDGVQIRIKRQYNNNAILEVEGGDEVNE